MPRYLFPMIPPSPGVPQLPRLPSGFAATRAAAGIANNLLWRILQTQTKWGIFDTSGNPLGDPSTVFGLQAQFAESVGFGSMLSTHSVEYRKGTRVSHFPIEKGGFASYNKVEFPASPRVIMTLTGTEKQRTAYLAALDIAVKSTKLYSVVTPEVTYKGFSLEGYHYIRSHNQGANLLGIEIILQEIREIASFKTTSIIQDPQSVGASPPIDSGKVQGKSPAISTLKSLSNKLQGLIP